jgi:hypothetical protein
MSTQYRLVQSGKTASGGCSAGQGSSEPVAPRIIIIISFNLRLHPEKTKEYIVAVLIARCLRQPHNRNVKWEGHTRMLRL